MKPRVLVVEDDPVSRTFFREVLAGLPATVDVAGGCAEAAACARRHAHVLWLVDAHLPDGSAVDLLPHLRASGKDADAPVGTVALAHTASPDPGLHAALRAAGFADVLVKPLGAAALLGTVRRCLRLRVRVGEPRAAPWNDAAAVAAMGGPAGVLALRALFAEELPAVVAQVEAALCAHDAVAMRDLLHRLASACAFTGASALATAVHRLQQAPFDDRAVAAFRDAAARLRSTPDGL